MKGSKSSNWQTHSLIYFFSPKMTQKGLKLTEHKRRFCQPDLPTPADSTFVIFFEGFQIQISKSFVSVYIIAREFRKSLSLHLKSLLMDVKLTFLFIILTIPLIYGECPEGWWRAGDACYTTSHSRMSWYSAQEVMK